MVCFNLGILENLSLKLFPLTRGVTREFTKYFTFIYFIFGISYFLSIDIGIRNDRLTFNLNGIQFWDYL